MCRKGKEPFMRNLLKIFILSAIFFALSVLPGAADSLAAEISLGAVVAIPNGQAVLPVYLSGNSDDLAGLTIPLQFNSVDLAVDSVSFSGSLKQPGMSSIVTIDNGAQQVVITYLPSSGLPVITAESGLLANIHFSVAAFAPDQVVSVDSINMLESAGPPDRWTRVELADGSGTSTFSPTFQLGTVNVQQTLDAEDGTLGMPAVFGLKQNFPNPFNPSTTISFSMPVRARATLRIYNILGQEVEVLVDGQLEPGNHEILWDAENEPSGIYFYRLSYGSEVLTKKMALLK